MTKANFWIGVRQKAKIWRSGALPGLAVVGCVAIARFSGALQTLEWMTFDNLWRWLPVEPPDTRVAIVGINEDDIRSVGDYPIPNRDLTKLLRIVQSYQPRAIGLDLFRDLQKSPNQTELAQTLLNSPNLIGIDKAFGQKTTLQVKSPTELPQKRVGFADVHLDPDGKLRRIALAGKVSGNIRYSFALLLAKHYLEAEGIEFKHGKRATMPIRFGKTELPRFLSNTGAYVGANAGGYQVLLNFRRHPHPFLIVSLTDIFTGKVKPEMIRDRIVIIGMTAISVNDIFMTSAVKGSLLNDTLTSEDQYQLIYGAEIQAHATSQIISAVVDNRSPLYAWLDEWEYLWIFGWGVWGIALGLFLQSPWKTFSCIGISSLGLIGVCYLHLSYGYWVPLVPTLLALVSAGLTTSLFDSRSKALLEQRSLTLKRTYDAVHNGPLQTLAAILRSDLPSKKLHEQLQDLNVELRTVFESMHHFLTAGDTNYTRSLPELLYEVYENTLKRDLPGFATIKMYIPPDFSPLLDCQLIPEQKQSLCTFLEEALCNVGKHAVQPTYLDVVCQREDDRYSLSIVDNGIAQHLRVPQSEGRGTIQAKELARHLRGKFQRRSHVPQGTVCELTWSAAKSWQWLHLWRKW